MAGSGTGAKSWFHAGWRALYYSHYSGLYLLELLRIPGENQSPTGLSLNDQITTTGPNSGADKISLVEKSRLAVAYLVQ